MILTYVNWCFIEMHTLFYVKRWRTFLVQRYQNQYIYIYYIIIFVFKQTLFWNWAECYFRCAQIWFWLLEVEIYLLVNQDFNMCHVSLWSCAISGKCLFLSHSINTNPIYVTEACWSPSGVCYQQNTSKSSAMKHTETYKFSIMN